VRSSQTIVAIHRGNSADTLVGTLTPKAIIWIVMQITKIHFLTSAALVVANGEARQTTAAGSGDAFADDLGRLYARRGQPSFGLADPI
jgi:hypothetical protein